MATDEEDNTEAFIVEGVILLIVGLVGILGNVSAIVVFSRYIPYYHLYIPSANFSRFQFSFNHKS